MAQLYSTGPAFIYVAGPIPGDPTAFSSAMFLGTCERAPRISVKRSWTPVMNDIGGQQEPFDMMYQGQSGVVTAEMTYWNEEVYELMARHDVSTLGFAQRGVDFIGEIGSLMVYENMAFHLILTFPHAAFPPYVTGPGGAMPAGYHFFAAILKGPDDVVVGTQPMKRIMQWECVRVWNRTDGGMYLYNNTTGILPSID